jgi:hypothetical protein
MERLFNRIHNRGMSLGEHAFKNSWKKHLWASWKSEFVHVTIIFMTWLPSVAYCTTCCLDEMKQDKTRMTFYKLYN